MKTAIQSLIDDKGAVSPVIGVILMVAITVILAAVIGTFVLGLGGQVSQSAPQASIQTDNVDADNSEVTFRHGGSEDIDLTELRIVLERAGAPSTTEFQPSLSSGASVNSIVFSTADTLTLIADGSDSVELNGDGSAIDPGADPTGVDITADNSYTVTFIDEPSDQIIAEKEFNT